MGRYSTPGSVLHDPVSDQAFFERLKECLPPNIEVVEMDTHAEDPAFVQAAIDNLIDLIEKGN